MRPDSMLVEPEMIAIAEVEVSTAGVIDYLQITFAREPVLASFIAQETNAIAGMLSLSGLSTEIVQGCHQSILELVLVCLKATSLGQYALWKDTAIGEWLCETEVPMEDESQDSEEIE